MDGSACSKSTETAPKLSAAARREEDAVHGEHALCTTIEGGQDRKKSDGPAPDHDHHVTVTDVRDVRAETGSGKDVARQQRDRVVEAVRYRDERRVRHGDTNILGLTAVQPLPVLDPAEQLAPHAASRQPHSAVVARATIRGERRHNPIANAERSDGRPDLHHLAERFMPHHGANVDPDLPTEVRVQIGAANSRGRHTNDHVVRRCDARFRDVFEGEHLDALKGDGPHRAPAALSVGSACHMRRRTMRIDVTVAAPPPERIPIQTPSIDWSKTCTAR